MTAGELKLGPFEIIAPIASGGMGQVWQGLHRQTGLPVAIKVLLSSRADVRFFQGFVNEVTQVARLDHPHIVRVLDHGEIPEDVGLRSEGRLIAGSPWFAMEYGSAGTLAQAGAVSSWGALAAVLEALLAGLAHAHARGVLHRDIKPANVLMGSTRDLRPGLKLTDFGLAFAWSEGDDTSAVVHAGTPAYMAPEQIEGHVRRQGPWTDLYALGCLAWELVCGRPPYAARNRDNVLRAHLRGELPAYLPRLAVPDALEPWLERMLAVDAADRFRHAADAAWSLRSFVDDPAADDGDSAGDTWFPFHDTLGEDQPVQIGLDPASQAVLPAGPPPVPDTWRRPEQRPLADLVGAGLGLFGMRTVGMVDRHELRDGIWARLRRVSDGRRPEALLLQGATGIGKTRLALELGLRAVEVGAAQLLLARHDALSVAEVGLRRMVARHLRCVGLTDAALRDRVSRALQQAGETRAWVWEGLASWLLGVGGASAQRGARLALLVQVIALLARERPVVLVLDDVQWSLDSLDLVDALLDEELPVLVLLTAHSGALEQREAERDRIAALRARGRLEVVGLPPLAKKDMDVLVQDLLLLESDLAAQVRRRSAGSPLFAVQLIGDWVRRGVLEVQDAGFDLRSGEQASLPDDIHVLWQERLATVLGARSEQDRLALELAAALGVAVERSEWESVCALATLGPTDGLAAALERACLTETTPEGWRFVHGMLQESVARTARETGRWAAHHEVCARVVASQPPHPGQSERLGRHLIAARRADEALGPLLDGATERWSRSDFHEALELQDLHQQTLDELRVSPADPRRGQGLLLRVRVLVALGRFDDADLEAGRCARMAKRHQWPGVEMGALRYRGMAAEKRGDLDLAEAMFLRAQNLAQRHGDPAEEAASVEHLGTVSRLQGDIEGSLRLLQDALAGFERVGQTRGLADCAVELAGTLVALGRPEEALPHAERAGALFGELQDLAGQASALNNHGDALRALGRHAEAERALHSAYEMLNRTGSQTRIFPLANLGLLAHGRGGHAEARGYLEAGLALAELRGRLSLAAWFQAVLLAPLAVLGEWEIWDARLEAAEGLLADTGFAEPDIPRHLEEAAGAARSAGHLQRASRAAALATDQYLALGDADSARRLEEAHARP